MWQRKETLNAACVKSLVGQLPVSCLCLGIHFFSFLLCYFSQCVHRRSGETLWRIYNITQFYGDRMETKATADRTPHIRPPLKSAAEPRRNTEPVQNCNYREASESAAYFSSRSHPACVWCLTVDCRQLQEACGGRCCWTYKQKKIKIQENILTRVSVFFLSVFFSRKVKSNAAWLVMLPLLRQRSSLTDSWSRPSSSLLCKPLAKPKFHSQN